MADAVVSWKSKLSSFHCQNWEFAIENRQTICVARFLLFCGNVADYDRDSQNLVWLFSKWREYEVNPNFKMADGVYSNIFLKI